MKKIYLSIIICVTVLGISFLKNANEETHQLTKETKISANEYGESSKSVNFGKNQNTDTSNNRLQKGNYQENKITEKKPEESTVHQNLLKSFQKIIKDDIYEIRESEIISKNTATKLETRISLVETSFKYPNLIVEEKGEFLGTDNETVKSSNVYVATHFIVHLLPGAKDSEFQSKLIELGCSLESSIGNRTFIISTGNEISIESHYTKKSELQKLNGYVDIVEPDYVLSIVKTPNDSRFLELWGLNNEGQTGGSVDKDIDGNEAWDKTTGSKDILVGIIDTGVDRNHQDLKDNMWTNPGEIAGNGLDDDGNGYVDDLHGWDFANDDNDPFDDNSHGTHCAGTIGGVGNNGIGVSGVCWDVSMVGLKFLNQHGSGALSDAVKAISYATKINVDLTSNSWGGGGFSPSMKNAIEEANAQGIGFIAAAGNHAGDNDKSPSYPASYNCENIISVGAHDHDGKSANFSCFGKTSVDIFAPGVRTLSTVPNNKYASFSGTSMATPHVAGAYALILSVRPEWKSDKVKVALMEGADEENSLSDKCVTGGRLNIDRALSIEPPQENLISISPSRLDFGELSINQLESLAFVLRNQGDLEVIITQADLVSDYFKHDLDLPFTMEPGTEKRGVIKFQSEVQGDFSSTLSLMSNNNTGPQIELPLFAMVTANPKLLINPQELHFGLSAGEILRKKVNLSNTGDSVLNFSSFLSDNQKWLSFENTQNNESYILPGQSTEFTITAFADQMNNSQMEAKILINSNDPENPEQQISISAQKLTEEGGLIIRPSSLVFEDTFIGQTMEKEITLSNTGTKTISLDRFSFRTGSSQFSHQIKLPLILEPGEKSSEMIYFSPTEIGHTQSEAFLLTNENGQEFRIYNMSGTAEIAPHMAVGPTALSASLSMNEEKQTALTISNTGGSVLEWEMKGITRKGGKSLTIKELFGTSHFTSLAKGQFDQRKGVPTSILGGGPDFHGYSWEDSNDATGPKHQWVDISKTGKRLESLSQVDDGYSKVSLPFSMDFYGDKQSEVFVSSNGYITFGAGSIEHGHFPLPSTMMPGNLIAPFAMDLNPLRGGEIYVEKFDDEVIIQWNQIKDFAGIGEYTFQASLNRNGVIYFHYEKLNGQTDRATTGIQNKTSDTGLLVAYNNQQIQQNSTIRVSTSPKWLHAPITTGKVPAGSSAQVEVLFKSSSILAGNYNAVIEVTSNSPDTPSIRIPVELNVKSEKVLIASPSDVNFSSVLVGESKSEIIELINRGNAPINIESLSAENEVFSTSLSSASINPGQEMKVQVSFQPRLGKEYQNQLLIKSDADNPTLEVSLFGMGVATPSIKVSPQILNLTVNAGEQKDGIVVLDNEMGNAAGSYELQSIETESLKKENFNPLSSTEVKMDPFFAEHHPNRLIVRFKNGHTNFTNVGKMNTLVKIERSLGKAKNPKSGKLAVNNVSLVLLSTIQSGDLRSIAEELEKDPAVLYAEPDYIVFRTQATNDPLLSKQWALPKIQASQAWEITKGSSNVNVAVIDTGIDYKHPDLEGNIWKNMGEIPNNGKDDDGNGYIDDVYGWDFVNNDKDPMDGHGHGTHVAGTIAAATNNGQKIAGVAWNAKMAGLKFLSDSGSGSTSGAIDAVAYSSAMGFKVSNNSWGGGGYSRALKEVITEAGKNGQIFCAAAGNSGSNNDSMPHYPSNYDCENIISVAASDRSDKLASFSCYGKNSVDLAAPGVSILSLLPDKKTASWSGTSMATPHVAGAATLFFAINPNATHTEVKNAIMSSVDKIADFEEKMITGGRLNVAKALGKSTQSWLTVSPTKGNIEMGGSTNLTFSVNAKKFNAGNKSAVAIFTTNDPKLRTLEIPVNILVTGEPELVLSTDTLNFGTLWKGSEKKIVLGITNNGTDELVIDQFSSSHSAFSSDKESVTIQTGEEKTIAITAKALERGTLESTLNILSNDPQSPSTRVNLKMNAVLPPMLMISPKSITLTMEPDQSMNSPVTIQNSGDATGQWEALIRDTEQRRNKTKDFDQLVLKLNEPGRSPEFSSPSLPADNGSIYKSNSSDQAAVRLSSMSNSSSLEVAVLGANSVEKNQDIANGLIETNRFAGVTLINTSKVTPTTDELMAFDSVMVYFNYGYHDSEKLGDNLADYADQGGGVITMAFESTTRFSPSLGGRWETEKYGIFEQSSTDTRNWNTHGKVLHANHPIMENFNSFEGYFRLNKTELREGAQIISEWKDGLPLVSCRNDLGNIVDLNFYPVSNKIMEKGWKSETDGILLIANSMEWVANRGNSNWITGLPLKGMVKSGEKGELLLTLNTSDLDEGIYNAEVEFTTNEPVNAFHRVNVQLEVRRNQAPIAKSSALKTLEDTNLQFFLEANDPENDPIVFEVTSEPLNGTLSGDAPNLTYQPNENFNGVDILKFVASDAKKKSAEATITIEVVPTNDAPWIKNEKITSSEDDLIVINPDFGDMDGDQLTLRVIKDPSNGLVFKNTGNQFLFFPDNNYNGVDEIQIEVSDGELKSSAVISLNLQPVNDAPIAMDSYLHTEEGQTFTFDLNATDVDGDKLTFNLISPPKHGKLTTGKNRWSYSPFENYNGQDFLTFRAFDGTIEGNIATVNFNIDPKNQPPQVFDASFVLFEDAELPIKLIAGDPDGDPLTFSIIKQPANGKLLGKGPNFTYIPEEDYFGTDSFEVIADDGMEKSKTALITLSIEGKNDAPKFSSLGTLSTGFRETPYRLKLDAEDIDGDSLNFNVSTQPAHGTCRIDDKELVYFPDPGFTGIEKLEIEVSDGKLASKSTLQLPITEHPNPIGIYVDFMDGGEKEQAFVNMVYELNEVLQETANHIIRMDLEKTESNYEVMLNNQKSTDNILTLEEWKERLPSMNLETKFSFFQEMENNSIQWKVASFQKNTSGTDIKLDNKIPNANNPVGNNTESKTEFSLDDSFSADMNVSNENTYTEGSVINDSNNRGQSKDIESPKMVIDVSSVRKIETAPNWYTMPGLGAFFDAGNNWIYQPELGWCYAKACDDGNSTWIFNQKVGWIWLKSEISNMTYTYGEMGQGWVYFPEESLGKCKVVFNYSSNTWIRM